VLRAFAHFKEYKMKEILRALEIQRWDDHRYYHHSRVNQSLHFLSATSFLASYALLFVYPVAAALLGWIVAMWSRQIGHFFFEPKGYDHINQATHEYKEEIKVGYNLRRKVVLLAIWAASPLFLLLDPTLLGVFTGTQTAIHRIGMMWLVLGIGGLVFRTVHLFFIRDVETGLVWMLKILTDPFHDLKLYCKAPLALMRGELIDPNLEEEVAERAARA
jgi:2-hydroxy-palmitic acid dioxygenase Mpo1-like protein